MFFGVTFIIFLGISLFISFYISYLNLSSTYSNFYAETDFEDAAIEFNPAPVELLKDVRRIDGIKEVTGRMVIKASMKLNDEHIKMILISVPDGEQPEVNKLYVAEGSYIPKGVYSSALLLNEFAEYHDIHSGEAISLEINGKKSVLKISGIVYSPEYIWVIEEGDFFVSPGNLGIAFIPYKKLEEFGYEGKINQIHFTVYDAERREEILNRVKKIFEPYGIKNFYTREGQPSNQALKLDLEGFKTLSILIPGFILLISIFAIYILLTRLINEQTPNIGVLRALGFTKNAIMFHYLRHSLVIGFIGSLMGILSGYILSVIMTVQYTEVINVPYYVAGFHPEILLAGLTVGTLTPAISGLFIAKKAANMKIVDALKGSYEVQTKGIEIDRFIPFFRISVLTKLSLRNTFRNKKRTVYSTFSVVSAIILIMNSMVFMDAFEEALDLQFNKVLNYDLEVRFTSYVNNSVLKEIKSIQGVKDAYPMISTWMLIESGDKFKSVTLLGLENQRLYNIYDAQGTLHMPPPKGILLPESISNNLSIIEGQQVTFVTEKGKVESEIYGVFKHSLAPSAFASMDYLQKLMGVDGYNTVIVSVDPGEEDKVKYELEKIGGVLQVNSKADMLDYINQLLEFSYAFIFFSLLFGSSLGFAAIFNTTSINIMERRRELATLKMLGYTTNQLGFALFIENMFIGIIGTAIGIPVGYFIAYIYLLSFSGELFQIPFVIYGRTYILTVFLIFVILSLSVLPGLRYISRMNIEKVTKEVIS